MTRSNHIFRGSTDTDAPRKQSIPKKSALGPTYLHPRQPLVDSDVRQNEGTGKYLVDDWRQAWFPYQSPPDCPSLVDVDMGHAHCKITEIDGTLPSNLVGDLHQNGPGNFGFQVEHIRHALNADGLITKYSFSDEANDDPGKFLFSLRFVKTQTFQQDWDAGECLEQGTFGTAQCGLPWLYLPSRNGLNAKLSHMPLISCIIGAAFFTGIKNAANTHIISFGGKLLPLYKAGLPYEFNQDTKKNGEDTMGRMLLTGKLMFIADKFIPKLMAPWSGPHGAPQVPSAHSTLGGLALVPNYSQRGYCSDDD